MEQGVLVFLFNFERTVEANVDEPHKVCKIALKVLE